MMEKGADIHEEEQVLGGADWISMRN